MSVLIGFIDDVIVTLIPKGPALCASVCLEIMNDEDVAVHSTVYYGTCLYVCVSVCVCVCGAGSLKTFFEHYVASKAFSCTLHERH